MLASTDSIPRFTYAEGRESEPLTWRQFFRDLSLEDTTEAEIAAFGTCGQWDHLWDCIDVHGEIRVCTPSGVAAEARKLIKALEAIGVRRGL